MATKRVYTLEEKKEPYCINVGVESENPNFGEIIDRKLSETKFFASGNRFRQLIWIIRPSEDYPDEFEVTFYFSDTGKLKEVNENIRQLMQCLDVELSCWTILALEDCVSATANFGLPGREVAKVYVNEYPCN